MPFERDLPIRWSLHRAESEFGRAVRTIRTGLQAAGISPGKDGKYSTREIATALFGFGTLERRAREAKMQRIIDEAEIAKIERDESRGRLIPLQMLKDYAADIFTQTVTFIRHSKLSDAEKRQLIEQLRATEFVRRKK